MNGNHISRKKHRARHLSQMNFSKEFFLACVWEFADPILSKLRSFKLEHIVKNSEINKAKTFNS